MPSIPEDADKPALTNEEIFLEADRRLRISIEAMGANTEKAIEALEFEDGNQWPDDIKNMRRLTGRPSLTINHTRTFVRRVVNNMRQQRPRIKVHPTGDGARIEKAKVIAGMIRHIETRSKASVAYDGAGEAAVKIGWGYARVLSEWESETSFQQELKILAIRNQFTVYDDPSAILPTGADRDWLLISEEMSRTDYRRKYPKAVNAEWRKGGPGDDGKLWESKEKIRLAEYFRVYKKPETIYLLSDGSGIYASDWEQQQGQLKQAGVDLVLRDDRKPVSRQSFRRVIEWYRLNGREVIEKQTLPGRWIPVVRCLGNVLDINGQVRYHGMVADLMDANRMLNYWATCETELIALAPRAPFMAAEGQTDGHSEWKDANQKAYSTLVYKPVHSNPDDPGSPVLPAPEKIPAVEVPAGVINARQGAEHDMMALAGMPHEPGQDKPGEVVSGVALRQRQALSDIGHFQYYDNQTQFIAHIGEILVDYIPHYYSETRMQRIIGEDGVPEMVPINQRQAEGEIKNDLSVGKYDVVMDTGPGYETKRMEGQEAMLDLLKTPLGEPIVKVGADLIVRNMDFAGAEDLADRLLPTNPQGMQKAVQALPKEAQGIVMAMQTQLQQAQQVIQQQALELKYGIAKAHLAAVTKAHDTEVTADTKRHDTEVRAATEIRTQHMADVTARDVAEIKAGATLLNTHVEAEHNRRAAEIELQTAEKAAKNGAQE